jgi:hypothetical protein
MSSNGEILPHPERKGTGYFNKNGLSLCCSWNSQ